MREHHLRGTKTRQAVLCLFLRNHAPLSAPHILDELKLQLVRVNKTTVYRELQTLETLGIIQSLMLQDRKQYFELATREHHHHLVCIQCEDVTDVDFSETVLSRQERGFFQEKNFKVLRHSLEFFGLCQKCQKLSGC